MSRVPGVASIQDERAVNLMSTQAEAKREAEEAAAREAAALKAAEEAAKAEEEAKRLAEEAAAREAKAQAPLSDFGA